MLVLTVMSTTKLSLYIGVFWSVLIAFNVNETNKLALIFTSIIKVCVLGRFGDFKIFSTLFSY